MQRILIAGEGGQGIQLIAEVLAKAAFTQGKKATYIPNFGVEQRGGVSLAFVIIDENPIPYPKFMTADYLVLMSERSEARVNNYRKSDSIVLDMKEIIPHDLPEKVHNMFILGKLLRMIGSIGPETVLQVLEKKISSKIEKFPELRELNRKALMKGFEG